MRREMKEMKKTQIELLEIKKFNVQLELTAE